MRTGEQPVDDPFVPWRLAPDEAIFAALEALDVKLLPRFDAIHLPYFCGKDDPLDDTVVFI